jgi:hypothetical protein
MEQGSVKFEGMRLVGFNVAPGEVSFKVALTFKGDPTSFDYEQVAGYIPNKSARTVSSQDIVLDSFQFGVMEFSREAQAVARIRVNLDAESGVEVEGIGIKINAYLDGGSLDKFMASAAREIQQSWANLIFAEHDDGEQCDLLDNPDAIDDVVAEVFGEPADDEGYCPPVE